VYYSLDQGTDPDLLRASAKYAGRSDSFTLTLGPFSSDLAPAGTKITAWVIAVSQKNISQAFDRAAQKQIVLTKIWGGTSLIDHFTYVKTDSDSLDPKLWIVIKGGTGVPLIEGTGQRAKLKTGATENNESSAISFLALKPSDYRKVVLEWRGKVSSASGHQWRVGMTHNSAGGGLDPNGDVFVLFATDDNKIRFITTDGSGNAQTTDNINTNPTSDRRYRLELDGDGTAARLYVDGVLKATHTTYLPTAVRLSAYMDSKTVLAAAKELDMDELAYFAVRSDETSP
jgi:hypothetical protein